MSEKEKRLNLKELSKAFGVSQQSVRHWIDRGIPCKRTSKGYNFGLAETIQWREKYLQETKQGGSSEYEAARTEKEIYRAKMAKLNYERMEGTLVLASAVRDQAFQTARTVRDGILAVPDRVSSLLAGEINATGKVDKTRVNEILGKELRQVLENLCSELNRSEVKNGEKN